MRYIDADRLRKDILGLPNCYNGFSDTYDKALIIDRIDEQPTADVIEIGKPYFYEEGYVLKDFHNDGVRRYFVIERAEE